jgi:hypothetical protein
MSGSDIECGHGASCSHECSHFTPLPRTWTCRPLPWEGSNLVFTFVRHCLAQPSEYFLVMLIESESGGPVASGAESVAMIEYTPIAVDLALEVLTLVTDM